MLVTPTGKHTDIQLIYACPHPCIVTIYCNRVDLACWRHLRGEDTGIQLRYARPRVLSHIIAHPYKRVDLACWRHLRLEHTDIQLRYARPHALSQYTR